MRDISCSDVELNKSGKYEICSSRGSEDVDAEISGSHSDRLMI
jgi:hypothetical protein